MIQDAMTYVRSLRKSPLPWLVLGKGPSAAKCAQLDLSCYSVFALNNAWRIHPETKIVHFSDLEAFATEGDDLCRDSDITVCMPWFPHVNCKPTRHNLVELATRAHCRPAITWLIAKERMLSYNSTIACNLPGNKRLEQVRIRFFSAEAAFQIILRALEREQTIYSLGVDGGSNYAAQFDKKTLLVNGRASFDAQFPEIEKTLRRRGATWVKL